MHVMDLKWDGWQGGAFSPAASGCPVRGQRGRGAGFVQRWGFVRGER